MLIFKNKIIKWTIIITGLVIVFAAARAAYAGTLFLGANEFYPIVPHPTLRMDSSGDGSFGAVRDGHTHEGIDIECSPAENVFCPFESTFDHISYPYADSSFWQGITMNGTGIFEGYEIKIFYMVPNNYTAGEVIKKGAQIGIAQKISDRYADPNMINHLHIELNL